MACDAAIAAVRAILPPPASPYERKPLPAMTARQAFKKINFWTLATIEEAINALVRNGEAESIQVNGSFGYRQVPRRRAGGSR